MKAGSAAKLIVDALLQRFLPLARRRIETAQAQTSEEKKIDIVEEATEFPLTKWIMEEDPAQVEHEQVDHDEGINEERVEQQQQSQVRAQVELSPLQEQDSLVPQQPEQQFQRSIALDKPKRERKKPKKYGFDQDEVNYALNVSQGDPTTRCLKDSCVYYHVFEDGMIILLLLYVDDMLIACQDMSRIQKLKMQLSKEFDMKDLGATQKILGMQIIRDRVAGKIWLSQAKYIQNILERFNVNEAQHVTTPLVAHYRLSALQCPTTEKELAEMSKVPYASVVGCLMYAMVCTRPDLAQGLGRIEGSYIGEGSYRGERIKLLD
ncbi:hypothetical protein EZV62_015479 [Acer yangbiense]|uniref:Reverse transcriptase Ty1/copia-type domain-containing protein n=1 Tax=Acer yangbiense TaxID=1000413 RepID=A0A5C7HKV9_9ROSI|nr:hypothetical protein EZV62_015479 [Acer yangbiense]